MIDHDDVDDVGLVAMLSSGSLFVAAVILMLILAYVVAKNEDECAAKTCPVGMSSKLADNDCLCVMKAK